MDGDSVVGIGSTIKGLAIAFCRVKSSKIDLMKSLVICTVFEMMGHYHLHSETGLVT